MSIKSMHFNAESKDDIAYYLRSIATINDLLFETIDDRFGSIIIRCSRSKMDDQTNDQLIDQVISKKTTAKIYFYDDPVGGMRISID